MAMHSITLRLSLQVELTGDFDTIRWAFLGISKKKTAGLDFMKLFVSHFLDNLNNLHIPGLLTNQYSFFYLTMANRTLFSVKKKGEH
jgi:hypothetical protein